MSSVKPGRLTSYSNTIHCDTQERVLIIQYTIPYLRYTQSHLYYVDKMATGCQQTLFQVWSVSECSSEDQECTREAAPEAQHQKRYQSNWKLEFPWLNYDSEKGCMYCLPCKNSKKTNAFTEGCTNFRIDNLREHDKSSWHNAAIESELLGNQNTMRCL